MCNTQMIPPQGIKMSHFENNRADYITALLHLILSEMNVL
jgi:hypothetical protein